MRLYLPATAADLADADGLTGRSAHAVTAALRAEVPEEDDEGLEMTATLAAADDSVRRIAGEGTGRPVRVVVVADVPDAAVAVPEVLDEDQLPTVVEAGAVRWRDVVAFLVDEDAAAEDVAAAAAGDEAALDRAADRDLLWYDAVERTDLARRLGG